MLLRNAALLERNARRSREYYAQAQRRNYPRGGARQRLLAQAAEAEAELRTVREEIEALRVEARREGALPGWLYEVEDEEIVVPEPAAPDGSDSSSDERDAGRNPLYLATTENLDGDAPRRPRPSRGGPARSKRSSSLSNGASSRLLWRRSPLITVTMRSPCLTTVK